ncbi:hypothetical protein GCM10017562_07540 [Streptomyces roseofulvus]|uniref:hypothetical protein n=1 Tax=Streptomyces roseofulvus TaxID=33902 RepID=UPI0031F8CA16
MDAASDPEPGEEIPDEAAELISGAKISVTVESRKPLGESGEEDFVGTAMKVSTQDGDLFEYRVVGDRTYLRADVRKISTTMSVPMPSADELPPEAGAFKKALEGEWVMFDTEEMEKAAQESAAAPGGGGAGAGEPSPAPTLDAETQQKLLRALREVVARDVDFATAGGEDGTERISATAPFRTLVTDLFAKIRPLSRELPPGVELPSDGDLKDAPDSKVTADFTLRNGELKEVYVDLAPLAEGTKVEKLGLVLKLNAGVTPVAPAGATELNVDEIMGGFAGAMMPADEEFDEGFEGEFAEGLGDEPGEGEPGIDVEGLDAVEQES